MVAQAEILRALADGPTTYRGVTMRLGIPPTDTSVSNRLPIMLKQGVIRDAGRTGSPSHPIGARVYALADWQGPIQTYVDPRLPVVHVPPMRKHTLRPRIVAIMEETGEPMTCKAIALRVYPEYARSMPSARCTSVRQVLDRMVARGLATKTRKALNGPYSYSLVVA